MVTIMPSRARRWTFRQGITSRFFVDLSGGYYDLDYTSVSGPLNNYGVGYYAFRLSFEAKIASHLTGQVFSQVLNRPSKSYGDLEDDQAGAQLTLRY